MPFLKRLSLLVILFGVLFGVLSPILATEPGNYENYDQSLFLDTAWYREEMIAAADRWNGGLYQALDATHDLAPVGLDKANIWKVNYHYTMFFTEVLRLESNCPDEIAALNASETR